LRPGRGSRNLAGVTRDKPSELRPSDPPAGPPVIVVADDDRVTRDTICSILTRAGYLVTPANDGQEAVEIVGQGGVDLVLLDILMPRLGGIEACRIIKSVTGDAFVPVMLVTVKTDTASRVEGLKIGADDYITKPFEEREMIARIEAMLRIKRLNDHLVSVRQKLERLSVYDELTGLYNFRYLHTRLREEFKRAERYHEPLACVVIDVDNLRMHNERGGQALGDAILRGVADSAACGRWTWSRGTGAKNSW
jgi:PleD family two-component response regulator